MLRNKKQAANVIKFLAEEAKKKADMWKDKKLPSAGDPMALSLTYEAVCAVPNSTMNTRFAWELNLGEFADIWDIDCDVRQAFIAHREEKARREQERNEKKDEVLCQVETLAKNDNESLAAVKRLREGTHSKGSLKRARDLVFRRYNVKVS